MLALAAVAAGAFGLFGFGVIIGSKDCGLAGIFGICQSEANLATISRVFDLSQQINDNVYHLKEESDLTFWEVSQELQAIRDIQRQKAKFQNAIWQTIF